MTSWLDADWPAPPGVRALTTTRHGLGVSQAPFDSFNLGIRCGDDVDAVVENRRQLEVALALPTSPRWLKQVHGIDVVRLDTPPPAKAGGGREGVALAEVGEKGTPPRPVRPSGIALGRSPAREPVARKRAASPPAFAGEGGEQADASVTSTPGTVLAILTADCLPVVFAAKNGDEIGAAHAGWRGLADGMLEATVAAMDTPADGIVAWLGPAAGPHAYEIGEDVFDAFVSRDAGASTAFVPTRRGHWKIDLYALARHRLAAVGVTDVHGGNLCTISDPARFFSHRRDQRSGRIATLAWIER